LPRRKGQQRRAVSVEIFPKTPSGPDHDVEGEGMIDAVNTGVILSARSQFQM